MLATGAADVLYVGGSGYLGDAAHIWLSLSGRGYLGHGHHIYILLKRQALFPWSEGDSGDAAIAAGKRLQEICREIWSKRETGRDSSQKVSAWHWRQRQFVREFDSRLMKYAVREELEHILQTMGTDINQWLQAQP